ncbi:MAG TPA: hypothetical protein DCX46_10720 [Bacteroidetes bacterium]|nr:hypothetical protein [Bacteroidota bacterium]
MEGLVVVNPTTVKKDTFGFPVYIERIVIDKIAIDHEGPLEVDFGKGELEFHYTGITFRDARKVRFRYKLEGFDRDWQDVGTRRAAFYTNVPPGTYSFHVVANAGDGSINERATEMHITILPPFWMTGWFRVLIGLFAIGLVAGAVRYVSIKKLKRRLQVVEAQASLERERMRISKDMHDELGASLTKITLLGELAKRDIDKKEMMQQHLQRISDASRQVAETMDEIVWAVNPKNDSVDSLTAYLLQYVQEYLSMTDLQYKFDIPDELPENHVTAEVRHNMFLVVKEALNNTVKHASATEVRISVRYVDSRLGISLEDNGKGFSAETVGRFNDGLQNMRKRMEEIGGIFELESNPSRGTCLRISVNV